jgi:hypothetical protein
VPDETDGHVACLLLKDIESGAQVDDLINGALPVLVGLAAQSAAPRELALREEREHMVFRERGRVRKELGAVRVRLLPEPVQPQGNRARLPFRPDEVRLHASARNAVRDVFDHGPVLRLLPLYDDLRRRGLVSEELGALLERRDLGRGCRRRRRGDRLGGGGGGPTAAAGGERQGKRKEHQWYRQSHNVFYY